MARARDRAREPAAAPGPGAEATAERAARIPPGVSADGLRVGVGVTLLGLLLTVFVSMAVAGDTARRFTASEPPSAAAKDVLEGDLVYLREGAPVERDLAVCVLDLFTYPAVCQVVNLTDDGYYVRYRAGAVENVTHLPARRVKGAIDPARTVRGTTVARYAAIAAIGIAIAAAGAVIVVTKGLRQG